MLFNPFKWERKIEPLRFEASRRTFIEDMERISQKTCDAYFNLLTAQRQQEIYKQNLANQDTLLQIAKGRYRIGNIAENDLLQMELRRLESENQVSRGAVAVKRAQQNLTRYLGLSDENIALSTPSKLEI